MEGKEEEEEEEEKSNFQKHRVKLVLKNGDTPLSVAKTAEIREIFETSRNFFNINIYG